MKKILLIITVVFLLISCSNAYIQKDFTQYEKKQLSILSNDIKNNLLKNNIKFIEKNIKDSYKNRYIIDNLYKIDFTGINVFISEPSYVNVYPTSLLALNLNEDTYYFELNFIYDNKIKKWLIFDLKEKKWAYYEKYE